MKPNLNDIEWAKIKKIQGRDFSEVEDNRKAFEIITFLAAFAAYTAIIYHYTPRESSSSYQKLTTTDFRWPE